MASSSSSWLRFFGGARAFRLSFQDEQWRASLYLPWTIRSPSFHIRRHFTSIAWSRTLKAFGFNLGFSSIKSTDSAPPPLHLYFFVFNLPFPERGAGKEGVKLRLLVQSETHIFFYPRLGFRFAPVLLNICFRSRNCRAYWKGIPRFYQRSLEFSAFRVPVCQ